MAATGTSPGGSGTISPAGGPTGHVAGCGTRRDGQSRPGDNVTEARQILLDTAADTPHPPT